MTEPAGPENSKFEKEARLRRFLLPFIYGLASANFFALIQFVGSEKVVSSRAGLLGLIVMSASVPTLIMYAVYTERILETKRSPTELSPRLFATMFTLGIVGIALALGAFEPLVGVFFITATAVLVERMANLFGNSKR